MISASILISQHWLSAIIGVSIAAWWYKEAPKEEKGLMLKFGNYYKHYMQRVPRLNPLVGIFRLLRRRKK